MLKYRLMPIAAFLLALLSIPAHAFWDPPYVTPVNPTAGEVLSVNIRLGVCDAIYSRQDYPQITRNANAIHVLEYGQHWEPGELCIFGVGTVADQLGVFPPGQYALTFDLFYIDFTGPHILTLGVVPFVVTDAAPSAIPTPTTSQLGLLALILALLALTASVLRVRRTG